MEKVCSIVVFILYVYCKGRTISIMLLTAININIYYIITINTINY
jgi:hypothetical protein